MIVTAATSAAQYAAATHNVFYSNRESPDNKKRIQEEHNMHIQSAETAKKQMDEDLKRAHRVISFRG